LQPLDAERVKEWRHRRMLSQQEVADRAGTSLFTIQRIERGEGNVRPKTGRGVAAALGIPIEELLPKVQAPLFREPPEQELPEERLLNYLRAWLDEIREKVAWARSILEKPPNFAEPLVEEPGVTPAATLTMWNTHIDALRRDAHGLAARWGEILEGISVESLPSEERVLLEALRRELQNFESAVEELQAKFYSDFEQHRKAVKLLPNLHEHQPSGATAADKRKSAGA
jgi:transcriptional regulator with XRE-family HTH domain